ncbi:MAG: GTPase Era [Rickettsiaceae bacterium]|nr:GTPase Era [Rickettsiaceae bacterium]
MDSKLAQKCTILSLIGKPNVGKSTLINGLVKYKISIVTPKVQTTRNVIRGIITEDNVQLVLLDTPGIFEPKVKLERFMVKEAWNSIVQADKILLLIEPNETFDDQTLKIIDYIRSKKLPIIVVVNKIDRSNNVILEMLKSKISELLPNSQMFFISALNNTNIDLLYKDLLNNAANSPWLYDSDEITTAPMKFMASEITREKLFTSLHQELPYNLTVETEAWNQKSENTAVVNQVIIVTRDSHKAMILGKSGEKIKQISMAAREEIEKNLNMKIHLYLHLKVRKWTEKPSLYLLGDLQDTK